MNSILLTFDIEDFINSRSIIALRALLETLRKYDFRALFFVTGHMAERISNFPDITEMLKVHEIGYHSSSHSVRPTIFEYTDVKNYEEAYERSIERETSHINPLTGKVEGRGGVEFVKELFNREILAYRAPGLCWPAPHLEALRDLGIKFDFSSCISPEPVRHIGITFYPHPVLGNWNGTKTDFLVVTRSAFSHRYTIIGAHESYFVNENMWDSLYHRGNPSKLLEVKQRRPTEINRSFVRFEMLLKQLSLLVETRLIEVTSTLTPAARQLDIEKVDFERCYSSSFHWAEQYFSYIPRFQRSHFLKFLMNAE